MASREQLIKSLPPKAVQVLRTIRHRTHNIHYQSSNWNFLLRRRLFSLVGSPRPRIPDHTWYDLQFRPADSLKYYGIPVPGLPPDDVQRRFTARTAHENLKQAFSFYLHVCLASRLHEINLPRILDFGGGWGRIARFFLRDTKPELISISDCLSDSIYWLRATNNPCNIIKNEPLPPIAGQHVDFDLIYAFSVFSHLSEEYLRAWIDYLLGCLRPGGYFVFTTRGTQFIDQLEHQRVASHLAKMLPNPQEVRSRHMKGELQFYPTGGGGELTSEFYGEAFIPRKYIEDHYGAELVAFTEDVAHVDQAVVVLRRQ
jgi:SAM-dependent methyltransferase